MSFGVGAAAPDCLSLAVAFHQAPSRYPDLLRGQGPLPPGIAMLLRLAGGATPEAEGLASPPFVSPDDLKGAARFFVEQAMLAREANHYRVLGVNPDASLEEIKEHHRLLMRLFHPDRNDEAESPGNAAIAARINLAYNALRQPAERAAYDARLRQAPKASTPIRAPIVRRAHREREPFARRLPPVVARHLPQFVLGAVALLSSAVVGVIYLNREPAGAIGGGDGAFESAPARKTMVAARAEPVAPQLELAQPAIPQPALPETPPRPQSAPPQPEPPRPALREPAAPVPSPQPQPQPQPRTDTKPKAEAAAPVARPVAVSEPAPPPKPAQPAVVATAPPLALSTRLAAAQSNPPAEQHAAAAPPAPASAPGITQEDLVALVARLSALYQKGDLDAFLALFDDGARIEHGGKDRIRSDYDDLFRNTAARQLYIWDMKWVPDGTAFHGEGDYQARVVRKGEAKARIYNGTIRLDVVQVDGAARLHGMFH